MENSQYKEIHSRQLYNNNNLDRDFLQFAYDKPVISKLQINFPRIKICQSKKYINDQSVVFSIANSHQFPFSQEINNFMNKNTQNQKLLVTNPTFQAYKNKQNPLSPQRPIQNSYSCQQTTKQDYDQINSSQQDFYKLPQIISDKIKQGKRQSIQKNQTLSQLLNDLKLRSQKLSRIYGEKNEEYKRCMQKMQFYSKSQNIKQAQCQYSTDYVIKKQKQNRSQFKQAQSFLRQKQKVPALKQNSLLNPDRKKKKVSFQSPQLSSKHIKIQKLTQKQASNNFNLNINDKKRQTVHHYENQKIILFLRKFMTFFIRQFFKIIRPKFYYQTGLLSTESNIQISKKNIQKSNQPLRLDKSHDKLKQDKDISFFQEYFNHSGKVEEYVIAYGLENSSQQNFMKKSQQHKNNNRNKNLLLIQENNESEYGQKITKISASKVSKLDDFINKQKNVKIGDLLIQSINKETFEYFLNKKDDQIMQKKEKIIQKNRHLILEPFQKVTQILKYKIMKILRDSFVKIKAQVQIKQVKLKQKYSSLKNHQFTNKQKQQKQENILQNDSFSFEDQLRRSRFNPALTHNQIGGRKQQVGNNSSKTINKSNLFVQHQETLSEGKVQRKRQQSRPLNKKISKQQYYAVSYQQDQYQCYPPKINQKVNPFGINKNNRINSNTSLMTFQRQTQRTQNKVIINQNHIQPHTNQMLRFQDRKSKISRSYSESNFLNYKSPNIIPLNPFQQQKLHNVLSVMHLPLQNRKTQINLQNQQQTLHSNQGYILRVNPPTLRILNTNQQDIKKRCYSVESFINQPTFIIENKVGKNLIKDNRIIDMKNINTQELRKTEKGCYRLSRSMDNFILRPVSTSVLKPNHHIAQNIHRHPYFPQPLQYKNQTKTSFFIKQNQNPPVNTYYKMVNPDNIQNKQFKYENEYHILQGVKKVQQNTDSNRAVSKFSLRNENKNNISNQVSQKIYQISTKYPASTEKPRIYQQIAPIKVKSPGVYLGKGNLQQNIKTNKFIPFPQLKKLSPKSPQITIKLKSPQTHTIRRRQFSNYGQF